MTELGRLGDRGVGNPVLVPELSGRGQTGGVMILGQIDDIGEGVIDNIIVSSSVHLTVGIFVVIAMTAATGSVAWHAVKNEAVSVMTQVLLAVAALVLAIQVLLGIKLLDQGQGIFQLYIHYVGGLIPLGAFAAAGWFARGDSGRSSRWLALLLAVGWFSAIMAFTIGRAYVNAG